MTEFLPIVYDAIGEPATSPVFDGSGGPEASDPTQTTGQAQNPGSGSTAGPACWSGLFSGHIHAIEGFSYGPAVNATVTIVHEASGETIASTTSGHDGYYEIFAAWPCGTYSVRAELGGLQGENPFSAYVHEDLGLHANNDIVVNVNIQ